MACSSKALGVDDLFALVNGVISLDVSPHDAYNQCVAAKELDNRLASNLLEVLLALEGDVIHNDDELKDQVMAKFLNFVELCSEEIIPQEVIRYELEVLEAAEKVHKTNFTRLKTKIYFRQQKFNLLREESEGYAKLITELLDPHNAERLKDQLLCLIGEFNVDPNRVVDVVLEAFECRPDAATIYIRLLKLLNSTEERLCSLLAFKYTFYRETDRKTPFSLYVVTAWLLKENMVDLMKVVAFMNPSSEEIQKSHAARATNSRTRAHKAETIVTCAVPVESIRTTSYMNEEPPPTQGMSLANVQAVQEAEDEKVLAGFDEETVLGEIQRLGLAVALAEQWAWPLTKILLDRLPEYYAVQASGRMCCALTDMYDLSIDDFYRKKCAQPLGKLGIQKTVRKEDEEKKCPVDKASSWTELVKENPLLSYIGPRVACRPKTLNKLIRSVKKFGSISCYTMAGLIMAYFKEQEVGQSSEDENLTGTMMELIGSVLLPGLTLCASNAALSQELWALIKLFPYTHRYRLYGIWKAQCVRHPELRVACGKVLGRTKYLLKRLSKETVRVMGRLLGKLCHIHPTTVFEYLLNQVQTFDNLIGPVVESIRFLTDMEFDVLIFSIMEQLSSPNREQMKSSDGTVSPWLQALGTMVGAIYKKYNVELSGILHYVAYQLKDGKSLDLLILREIVENMGSVEGTSSGATQDQLEALCGGEQLRQESGSFASGRNRRLCGRLRDAVLQSQLAEALLILTAQQRELCTHVMSSSLPLKLVGEMVDQCRYTLLQFGSFLQGNVKVDEYSKRMPPAETLMGEYHLGIDDAMYLTRPAYMPKVYEDLKRQAKAMASSKTTSVDASATSEASSRELASSNEEKPSNDSPATNGCVKEKKKLDETQKAVFFKSAMDGVVGRLVSVIREQMPQHTCNDIRNDKIDNICRLVVAWWLLSTYDIEVPTAAYQKAVDALKKQQQEVFLNLALSKSRQSREEERLKNLEQKLRDEEKKQTEHVYRVRKWLMQAREELFTEGRQQQSAAFLQLCIIPRAIYSELDACYAAKMMIWFHQQKTPLFQTVVVLDKLFLAVSQLMTGLSEAEAGAFGRFLGAMMAHVGNWRADKAVFEKECDGFPGFLTKVSSTSNLSSVTYEMFRNLCYKWQQQLHRSFREVLNNPKAEYILIRNCFLVMNKIVDDYPVLKTHRAEIEATVIKVRDQEKGHRDDLSLKAASYLGRLKMAHTTIYELHQYVHQKPKSASAKEHKERKRPVDDDVSAVGEKKKKKKDKEKEKASDSSTIKKEIKEDASEVENGRDRARSRSREFRTTPRRVKEEELEAGQLRNSPKNSSKQESKSSNGKDKDNVEQPARVDKKKDRESREKRGSKRDSFNVKEDPDKQSEPEVKRSKEKKEKKRRTEDSEHRKRAEKEKSLELENMEAGPPLPPSMNEKSTKRSAKDANGEPSARKRVHERITRDHMRSHSRDKDDSLTNAARICSPSYASYRIRPQVPNNQNSNRQLKKACVADFKKPISE